MVHPARRTGCCVETNRGLAQKVERSGLSGAAVTHRTTSSAASEPVFIRISGFRPNPIKYTDPDGRVDKHYLGKGLAKEWEGKLLVGIGNSMIKAGWASVFINPAAPAVIDEGNFTIEEGLEKIEEGKNIQSRAWAADSIGKGHAYKNHVQSRNEFGELGITGDGSDEDKERFVSLINSVLENPTAHKSNANSGHEMYLDEERGIIVFYDPAHKDSGSAFRPEKDNRHPQSAREHYDSQ
jgi:hypothetical protein